jgi:hypothetical protein
MNDCCGGHEDAFPLLRLSVGYRFSKPTLAAMLGNGEDAPIPVVRRQAEYLSGSDPKAAIKIQQHDSSS